MRFRSMFAFIAVAPLLIAATEPLQLPPSSKWVLDYGDDSCRLTRTFGDPATPTVLVIERVSPISGLSMVAIGKPLRASIGTEKVLARFLPAEDLRFEDGRPGKSASDKDPAVLWQRVDFVPTIELQEAMRVAQRSERPGPADAAKRIAEQAERAAASAKVTSIEITARRNRPVVLATGSLGRPIKMLDDCTRHQLRGWGVDPAIEDKIARPVWTSTSTRWFTSADYPRDTLRRNEESVVEARLLVDATGNVTKCTSLSHVAAPEFSTAVCNALTRRARYEPAELADGTKVPSYTVTTVRFVMPRR